MPLWKAQSADFFKPVDNAQIELIKSHQVSVFQNNHSPVGFLFKNKAQFKAFSPFLENVLCAHGLSVENTRILFEVEPTQSLSETIKQYQPKLICVFTDFCKIRSTNIIINRTFFAFLGDFNIATPTAASKRQLMSALGQAGQHCQMM